MENGSDDCVCPGRSMKTAYTTIKGFEVIRKRQCILLEPGVTGEVRFVNKLFDLSA